MSRSVTALALAVIAASFVLAPRVIAQSQSVPGSTPSEGPDASTGHHGQGGSQKAGGHTGAGGHAHHSPGMVGVTPTMPGHDAFGAIAEVVRILEADPGTDWSKVDLERLRQHLIAMNEVVLRSAVKRAAVPGGLVMEVTGAGRTAQALRAMVIPHAGELDQMPDWSARAEVITGGVRLTVVAKRPDDARTVARIRGLGFAGLITAGAHHQVHHLAMARGEAVAAHRH